jgi:hypothetical protein
MGVRAGDERMIVRPGARDRPLQDVGCELGESVGDERPDEHLRPAQHERRRGGDREPDRAVAARIREALEDRVEEAGAVRRLPALELPVPPKNAERLGE